MNREAIVSNIVETIKPYITKAEALPGLSEKSDLLRDLGINSARLVDIVLAFEDRFDVAIADEEADRVITVGDAISLIETKLAA